MKDKFYATKEINETLDMRLVIYIQNLIATMEGNIDYLQVFNISGNTMIHSQGVPEYTREYRLSKKYEDIKIFCIRTDVANQSYWTLMYSYEY